MFDKNNIDLSLVLSGIAVAFMVFHLFISIKFKRFLCNQTPTVWVKESLDRTNIQIKMDIFSIALFSAIFIACLCMKLFG